jgi:hypothetical protein
MAWTTSVWGSASKAAVISSALGGTIREGEEECMICRADMPASVSLRPCCHSICLACVERMRAATIFKVGHLFDQITASHGFSRRRHPFSPTRASSARTAALLLTSTSQRETGAPCVYLHRLCGTRVTHPFRLQHGGPRGQRNSHQRQQSRRNRSKGAHVCAAASGTPPAYAMRT